jgi:phage baseplate assembly protein W
MIATLLLDVIRLLTRTPQGERRHRYIWGQILKRKLD